MKFSAALTRLGGLSAPLFEENLQATVKCLKTRNIEQRALRRVCQPRNLDTAGCKADCKSAFGMDVSSMGESEDRRSMA